MSLPSGLKKDLRLNGSKKTTRLRKIKSITYRYLSGFVADYKNPSIHVKKARIWSLRQFFHYLKLNGYVNENIATDLPYPKIEKTVTPFSGLIRPAEKDLEFISVGIRQAFIVL